jgi:poly-gamma-glutamate capsule biosynthesis protein CapA/YwtB (metallophosphatase superfamily)
MKNILDSGTHQGGEFSNTLQNWMMVALTLTFLALYAAVLFGSFKHWSDERLITHLEPVIFVVIGYFFGRLPARPNEQTLRDEIRRQIRRADAAQFAKEQSQQAREALEEKIKNVRTTLAPSATKASSAIGKASGSSLNHTGGAVYDNTLRQAVDAALKMLDS